VSGAGAELREALAAAGGLDIPSEILALSAAEIVQRTAALKNEAKFLRNEVSRLRHEAAQLDERVKDNNEKVAQNKKLPYLIGHIVEVLDVNRDGSDDASMSSSTTTTTTTATANNNNNNSMGSGVVDDDALYRGKSCVVKTSNRQTIYLPVPGLIDIDSVRPGDLVGVNKDSYLILDTLPKEFDSRVKAMEVDEKPAEDYSQIGGLDKQIKELVEAVVLPITNADRFKAVGISPPKGCLLYGPPGTGKTLMARACAAETKSCFLKLAAPSLVQMFIGDGAKMVRDAFELAKSKAPAIIFIDELDAIGGKRFNSDKSGDREVQRTMLELLNQLDGFDSMDTVKVIAATNRVDVLDPALLRSGRIDRKIEFPLPNEASRSRIMEIHAEKFTALSPDVNFEELARCTQEFNGAQLKAVVVEAGMIALRRNAAQVEHEDFVDGIAEVQAKKKESILHYT
jgi:26S proteasome regulatory subunit T5